MRRWSSRKFQSMIAAVVVNLGAGFGYDVDPAIVLGMISGLVTVWILVEGWSDKAGIDKKPDLRS